MRARNVQKLSSGQALALYRAPLDFVQVGNDLTAATRTVSLSVQSASNPTTSSPTPIAILRPPVVLVHGLWDEPAGWNEFNPLINDAFGRFKLYYVRTAVNRIGARTCIRSTIHRIAGFHKTASSTPRAAEGVMTSYETRSVFSSGRVKQAYGPNIRTFQILERLGMTFLLSYDERLKSFAIDK